VGLVAILVGQVGQVAVVREVIALLLGLLVVEHRLSRH
jgi:hypothetical protein